MMTSCWRGLGNFLGECVPHSEVPTRPSTSRHVGPSLASPSLSRSSNGTAMMTSLRSTSVRPDHRTRYLIVQPASPRDSTVSSQSSRAGSRVRRNTTSSVVGRTVGNVLYSERRISEGEHPFVLLPGALQVPSVQRNSVVYSYGFKCPVCSKMVLADDLECHLVICLTKPRITYNEDVLSEDKGECVICFEDLSQGDTIARLPCLCIYHKGCIDEWFQINRSCPGHPYD